MSGIVLPLSSSAKGSPERRPKKEFFFQTLSIFHNFFLKILVFLPPSNLSKCQKNGKKTYFLSLLILHHIRKLVNPIFSSCSTNFAMEFHSNLFIAYTALFDPKPYLRGLHKSGYRLRPGVNFFFTGEGIKKVRSAS